MYEYRCKLISVVDGDTLHLDVDLGLDLSTKMTVRLYGINAPEKQTPEGKVAKTVVEDWFVANKPELTIFTKKDKKEKYGRYLGVIYSANIESLNDYMVKTGNAVPYML